ncbi:MAG: exopolysaccharide biosynthesis polyprenyl glycosylphosphotransferase [Cyanobacteria bacterium]|nr:exopolysaccharide biosynthesis polyprenyl glycosylphosphotransferase [Cyanobacteriota bacterium]
MSIPSPILATHPSQHPTRGGLTGGVLRLYGKDINRLLRVLDPTLITALFLLAESGSAIPLPIRALAVFLFTALILPTGKLYRSYRQTSLWTLVRRVSTSWALVLTALLLLGFLLKISATFSRLEMSLWALAGWILLLLNHVGSRKLLRWHRLRGGNTRTIAFWGTPSQAIEFHRKLLQLPWIGLRLVAWFEAPHSEPLRLPPTMPPSSGGLREMRLWLNSHDVDQIYFSYLSSAELPLEQVLRFFGDTCKPVYYLPSWANSSMQFEVDQLGDAFTINLWGQEGSYIDHRIKRLIDLVGASLALVLLALPLLVIALLVATISAGPVFFAQTRYGLDGRPFNMLKFRTMTVTEDGSTPGLQQARRDDPRVTPLGRILRRWSLDELPQLFNVLNGSMSLVGPRPHAVDHNEHYRHLIPGYMQRHSFKPGMTGLAQVEGWRGETAELDAMARRVEADLRYQREWSLGMDVRILLRTLFKLRSRNAY